MITPPASTVSLTSESEVNNRNFSKEIIGSISSLKKQKLSRFKVAAMTLAVFGAFSLSAPVNALTITTDSNKANGLTLTNADIENTPNTNRWYGLSVANSTLSGKNGFHVSVSKSDAAGENSVLNLVDLTDAQLQWQGNVTLSTNSALLSFSAISMNNSSVSIEGTLTADLTATRTNDWSKLSAISVGEGQSALTVSEKFNMKALMM